MRRLLGWSPGLLIGFCFGVALYPTLRAEMLLGVALLVGFLAGVVGFASLVVEDLNAYQRRVRWLETVNGRLVRRMRGER